MLRIFEAIKKSPFLNGNTITRPISEKASAEMGADACLDIISNKQHKNLENRIKNANFRYKIVPKIQTDTKKSLL